MNLLSINKTSNKFNQTIEDVFVKMENRKKNLSALVLKTLLGVKSPLDNIL